MVQSGKLSVPKSLLHYVDDHSLLLEQLFAILTLEDIEGMLPCVLKVQETSHNYIHYAMLIMYNYYNKRK